MGTSLLEGSIYGGLDGACKESRTSNMRYIQMFIQIINVLYYRSLTNDITSGIILLAIFVILIFGGHQAKTNQEY